MTNDERTGTAADSAARAAQRGETGASVPAGGAHAPADVTNPGSPEHEGRTPGREASGDVNAAEAPELLGERSDYPILYGEDPGDIGQ